MKMCYKLWGGGVGLKYSIWLRITLMEYKSAQK